MTNPNGVRGQKISELFYTPHEYEDLNVIGIWIRLLLRRNEDFDISMFVVIMIEMNLS